jgi:hypothetical protein
MKNTKIPDALRTFTKADWAAWSAEAAQPKGMKGRKFSAEICAKLSAAQRARFARQRAALAEALKNRAPEPPAPPERILTVSDCLFAAMLPGQWYSTRDMAEASGAKYQACKAYAVTWFKQGWLQRAQNPVWRPVPVGHRQEPKWLYSLAPKALERHRLGMALQ